MAGTECVSDCYSNDRSYIPADKVSKWVKCVSSCNANEYIKDNTCTKCSTIAA